jgi:hypothetical protein
VRRRKGALDFLSREMWMRNINWLRRKRANFEKKRANLTTQPRLVSLRPRTLERNAFPFVPPRPCSSEVSIFSEARWRERRQAHLSVLSRCELQDRCWQFFSLALLTSFTSSEQRETAPHHSSCVRKPRLLFQADRFQSWDARLSTRRNAMCPRHRPGFPRPILESFDFHR